VPGQRLADAAEVPFEFELDSIRIFDRPPFASERGYSAYARAHGDPPLPLRLDDPAIRR